MPERFQSVKIIRDLIIGSSEVFSSLENILGEQVIENRISSDIVTRASHSLKWRKEAVSESR